VLKRPLRPLCISIATTVLFAGVCACSTAADRPAAATPSSTHAATRPSPDAASLATFAKEIGVTCETRQERLACIGGRPEVGDYYDVDLHPGCGDVGTFGAVIASDGADLRDRIAPIDRRTTARVAKGQLLCIEATGWAGKHASYYYVRQVPARSVAVCAGNPTCGSSDDRPAHGANPLSSCAITPNGQPTSACAAGWIRSDDVKRTAKPQ
jgi:hypothetical protein